MLCSSINFAISLNYTSFPYIVPLVVLVGSTSDENLNGNEIKCAVFFVHDLLEVHGDFAAVYIRIFQNPPTSKLILSISISKQIKLNRLNRVEKAGNKLLVNFFSEIQIFFFSLVTNS
jgi:hypothetical protein